MNPRGPMGHRLSRPAPYQAREPPLDTIGLRRVSMPPPIKDYLNMASAEPIL